MANQKETIVIHGRVGTLDVAVPVDVLPKRRPNYGSGALPDLPGGKGPLADLAYGAGVRAPLIKIGGLSAAMHQDAFFRRSRHV
jgi:hypothetical protein